MLIKVKLNQSFKFAMMLFSQVILIEQLMDDIPFNHLVFIKVLKYFNIKSYSAYDGQMAIEMIKNQICQCTYKLIFIDIDVPGIDGYQTTMEIQQFFEQYNMSAVIIMCSKFDSKENIDIAYKSGMKDIHPKPIKIIDSRKYYINIIFDYNFYFIFHFVNSTFLFQLCFIYQL